MESTETTSQILFLLAWVLGVASWFGAVIESIGMWRFWPSVFRFGLMAIEEPCRLERIAPMAGQSACIETQSGVFWVLSETECLFRSKIAMFGFRIHTPFPLKGSISWVGAQATIRGRVPVGPSLFLGFWLMGWTASAAMTLSAKAGSAMIAMPPLVLGFAMVGGMVAFSIPLERNRLRQLVEELKARSPAPGA